MNGRGNRWLASFETPDLPLRIIAHRGDSFRAPENTLAAAELGRQAGAFAWELDVQATRDGVLIVLHDDTLERTTNVRARYRDDPRGANGYPASAFLWEEIETLDAGSWFVSSAGRARSARDFGTLDLIAPAARAQYASGMIRVPTLENALELTERLDWLVNVEIKGGPEVGDEAARKVAAAIQTQGIGSRVLISSFDQGLVAAARQAEGDHAVALLSETAGPELAAQARAVGAQAIHVGTSALALARRDEGNFTATAETRAIIMRLHSSGLPILVYTVNDREPGGLQDQLDALGVAGIFTDDPSHT